MEKILMAQTDKIGTQIKQSDVLIKEISNTTEEFASLIERIRACTYGITHSQQPTAPSIGGTINKEANPNFVLTMGNKIQSINNYLSELRTIVNDLEQF